MDLDCSYIVTKDTYPVVPYSGVFSHLVYVEGVVEEGCWMVLPTCRSCNHAWNIWKKFASRQEGL